MNIDNTISGAASFRLGGSEEFLRRSDAISNALNDIQTSLRTNNQPNPSPVTADLESKATKITPNNNVFIPQRYQGNSSYTHYSLEDTPDMNSISNYEIAQSFLKDQEINTRLSQSNNIIRSEKKLKKPLVPNFNANNTTINPPGKTIILSHLTNAYIDEDEDDEFEDDADLCMKKVHDQSLMKDSSNSTISFKKKKKSS